jgi:deazaflavin-dependent oxidoreductase (nitroreductase family)
MGQGRRRSWYHRTGLTLTRSVPGVFVLKNLWTPLDKLTLRLSGGRRNLAPRDIPEMVLLTSGRRSGRTRATPVLYLKVEDRYVIVGSNYGDRRHPAWTHNLQADPRAVVQLEGRRQRVVARRATTEEFERFWPRLLRIWPGWSTYRRMTDREFRMFVLDPE